MDHFNYINNTLHCESTSVLDIARAVGTPCYVYSAQTIRHHLAVLNDAFEPLRPQICYAIKSNANLAVISLIKNEGAGMDLVSGGELYRAQHAGVDPATCVFAGVGKTAQEIRDAIRAGVGWFNVESPAEFEHIAAIASNEQAVVNVALRVNPDVDPETHEYTTTGTRETKFGVDLVSAVAFFERYATTPSCNLSGLHLHLGSPIYDSEPYVKAITKLNGLIQQLQNKGHSIKMIDLGGGFGADYETGQTPPWKHYADAITPLLKQHVANGCQIVLEPGRSIIANAGILLTKVLYIKQGVARRFAICDGGMNVLMRPSHYGAFHFIWPARVSDEFVPTKRTSDADYENLQTVDVVGPICETGDFLARERQLPPLKKDDILSVFSAGAYGMAMANQYNSHPRPPEILVDGDVIQRCRRRETYADLIEAECDCDHITLQHNDVKRPEPTA